MNRYQNIPLMRVDNKIMYMTTRYPEIPLNNDDIYVYTTAGDRYDTLANQYYKDSSLWWIISIANTAVAGTSLPSDLPQDSLLIPQGSQIRIPADYISIVEAFQNINVF